MIRNSVKKLLSGPSVAASTGGPVAPIVGTSSVSSPVSAFYAASARASALHHRVHTRGMFSRFSPTLGSAFSHVESAVSASAVQMDNVPSGPMHYQLSLPRAVPDPSETENSVFHLTATDKELKIVWGDGHMSVFHYLWLRDSCRCPKCFHPSAKERMFDTTSMEMGVRATCVDVSGDGKTIRLLWASEDGVHESVFECKWLREHCYTIPASSNGPSKPFVWGSKDLEYRLPQIQYEEVMSNDSGLKRWLNLLDTFGFSLVKNVPTESGEVEKVARRVGFLKETFWGHLWSVKSTPNPSNLSLTGAELKAHSDFTWSESPPGLQFLHCLEFNRSAESGGHSTLIDGLKAAEVLRERDHRAYEILTSVKIPFSFQGPQQEYRVRAPMIQLDENNRVVGVRHNQANRAPLDVPPHLVEEVYRAIMSFQRVIADPEVELKFLLEPGDLLVFNNRRLLHGRKGYDASKVSRHLEGCYMDIEEYMCRKALLESDDEN